jgi:hypothetical protein
MKKLFNSILQRNPDEPFISESQAKNTVLDKTRDASYAPAVNNQYGMVVEELSFEDFARIMSKQNSLRA